MPFLLQSSQKRGYAAVAIVVPGGEEGFAEDFQGV
jgi:hypothetical protein